MKKQKWQGHSIGLARLVPCANTIERLDVGLPALLYFLPDSAVFRTDIKKPEPLSPFAL